MEKFSKEVCEKIQTYVYRLIDPRNGQTFYVGKGKNNRVFAHANDALDSFDGQKYIEDEEDYVSLKVNTIREIKRAGLEVLHVIQKYGLTNEEAFLVESVLIDIYGLGNLTNKVKGHHAFNGPINTVTLEREESIKEYQEDSSHPKYIIIKVKDYWINERGSIYEAVRSSWKMSINKARNYSYVLAVVNGIVRDVFEVNEWIQLDSGRIEFNGVRANQNIACLFINKKIPERFRKKGQACPFLYSDSK